MGVREVSVRVRPSRSVTRLVEMMLLEGMGWGGGGVTAGWGGRRKELTELTASWL